MKGPSVTSVSPSRTRTVLAVAVGGSCFAPTREPDFCSSSVYAMYSGSMSPLSAASSLWIRSRYCMSRLLGECGDVDMTNGLGGIRHPPEQSQGAFLVEVLVQVAAFGALDAGRTAVVAPAARQEPLRVGHPPL